MYSSSITSAGRQTRQCVMAMRQKERYQEKGDSHHADDKLLTCDSLSSL